MSVVCVKRENNTWNFASDSILCSNGTKLKMYNFTKLSNINNIIIGACGNAEEACLLQLFCKTNNPLSASEKDIMDFFYKFYEFKHNATQNFSSDNDYIIGYEGKVFFVSGLMVVEISEYTAIGAGRDYALAVMSLGHSAKKAVEVACDLCCYVAQPIVEEVMEVKI